ncbi:MAG: GntR family transcriptional regulator [Fervidobacterium sp.]
MWFSIDFHSHKPVYIQIKENIKEIVLNGLLNPGDFIPSIRTLAKDLGVNLNTVARAYRELEQEGVIKVERGEGYTVVGVNKDEIKNAILEEFRMILLKLKKTGVTKQQIITIINSVIE